jgi:hypothetical protein
MGQSKTIPKREGTFHVSTSRQHLAEIDAVVESGRVRTRSEALRSAWMQAKGAKIPLFSGVLK